MSAHEKWIVSIPKQDIIHALDVRLAHYKTKWDDLKAESLGDNAEFNRHMERVSLLGKKDSEARKWKQMIEVIPQAMLELDAESLYYFFPGGWPQPK